MKIFSFAALLFVAVWLALASPGWCQSEDFVKTKALAEKGDAWAQLSLADFYREGIVVTKDYAEALKWARKAADQNYSMAQYLVAGFYSEGWGIEINKEEAFKWFSKAAYNGLDMAQKSVANCYNFGHGVEQNSVESYAWLNIAAKTDKKAAEYRDNMEKWLTKEQITEAQKRTKELLAQIETNLKSGGK